jgi:hypothetical protein
MYNEKEKKIIKTSLEHRPRHIDDAFIILSLILMAKEGDDFHDIVYNVSPDLVSVIPILAGADLIHKHQVDNLVPIRVTWKGLQFMELYRHYHNASGEEKKALWRELLSFY